MNEQDYIIVVTFKDKTDGHTGTYIGDKGLFAAMYDLAKRGKEPHRIETWSSFCRNYKLRQEVIVNMERE